MPKYRFTKRPIFIGFRNILNREVDDIQKSFPKTSYDKPYHTVRITSSACLLLFSYHIFFCCTTNDRNGIKNFEPGVTFLHHSRGCILVARKHDKMTTLSGQLLFVLLLFVIYLFPRVYKNFMLTCIVYLVLVLVDDDQYFKKCAASDLLCKRLNISFIIVFAIHLILGILLIIGDIKV